MALNSISIDSATLQPAQGQSASKSASSPQPVQDSGKVAPVPGDQVFLSGNGDGKYHQLQQKKEQANAAAGAIRVTDRSLQILGQKIDAMKAPLEAIVKNFPPFSPEDKARMKLMRTYASIRKEIDELTLPPPPPDVAKPRQAVTLPSGLPMDATDSQIADHVANLDAAGSAVQDARAGLAADTGSFVQGGRFQTLISPSIGADTTSFEAPLTDSAASQKSLEVGRQFATTVSQGVSPISSQFLKGLS